MGRERCVDERGEVPGRAARRFRASEQRNDGKSRYGSVSETVVCVGALVRRADSVLLVRQSQGHPLEGQWTIPWGRLDDGESPSAAILREIAEESAITARIEGLLGFQELPEPWVGMLGLLYLCRHAAGSPAPDRRETDRARYFRAEELGSVAGALEPLSAWLCHRVLRGDFTLLKANDSGPFSPSPVYV